MHRLLTTTAVALLLGVAPALAIDDSQLPAEPNTVPEAQSEAPSALPNDESMPPSEADEQSLPPQALNESSESGNQPATQSGVTPDASKQANQPAEGSPDTSGGAAEQSSAPPTSGAATADDDAAKQAQSSDTSSGAKEQSSAPEGSSAADKSKPNPTMGPETSKE
jgi:hypothetical protein